MQLDNEISSVNGYNTRNIFLKNHTQKVVEKLVPDPFIKKTKLSISLD